MKYWFASYNYAVNGGFGFGNCWVSGTDFLRVNEVEDWVNNDIGHGCSARVISWQEVSKEQYEHGMAHIKRSTTK